jgi:hypothetical protein
MSMLKRQRELKKAEKAAQKRAKRHGIPEQTYFEPRPTVVGLDTDGDSDDGDGEEVEETASVDDVRA